MFDGNLANAQGISKARPKLAPLTYRGLLDISTKVHEKQDTLCIPQMEAPMHTFCGVALKDTLRILYGMKWYEAVREHLKAKHIKQMDLAPILGVTTRGAVGHYLRGRREPSLEQFTLLAERIGLDPGPLLYGRRVEIGHRDRLLADQVAAAVVHAIEIRATPLLALPAPEEPPTPPRPGRAFQKNNIKEATRPKH